MATFESNIGFHTLGMVMPSVTRSGIVWLQDCNQALPTDRQAALARVPHRRGHLKAGSKVSEILWGVWGEIDRGQSNWPDFRFTLEVDRRAEE